MQKWSFFAPKSIQKSIKNRCIYACRCFRVKPKIHKIVHGPFFLTKLASGRQFHETSDPKSWNQASRWTLFLEKVSFRTVLEVPDDAFWRSRPAFECSSWTLVKARDQHTFSETRGWLPLVAGSHRLCFYFKYVVNIELIVPSCMSILALQRWLFWRKPY